MRQISYSVFILSLVTLLQLGCDGGGDGVSCDEGMEGFVAQGEAVCIDALEFSNAGYVEFLNEYGNLCEDHECMHTDEPGSRIYEAGDGVWEVEAGYEEFPVVRVTFHGALEACDRIGKSLCSEVAWEKACQGSTGQAYPYGESFDPDACNGSNGTDEGAPVEAGSMPGCEGGYDGIYDMSGNVYEWTSSCADGPCNIRGGSFAKAGDGLTCGSIHEMDGPAGHREDLGFRCCSPG